MPVDTDFLKARSQIVAKIEKLEVDLKYWRDELSAFDRVETTMRKLVHNGQVESEVLELKSDPAPQPPNIDPALLTVARQFVAKRRGDLRDRVLAVVQARNGQKVSSTEVERAILQSGYKPNGKNFDIAVYQTLKRLATARQIIRRKYAGNVTFSAITQ